MNSSFLPSYETNHSLIREILELARDTGYSDFGEALAIIDQDLYTRDRDRSKVARELITRMYLALAERDPKCLVRAVASRVIANDLQGFLEVRDVVSVRREKCGIEAVNASVFASLDKENGSYVIPHEQTAMKSIVTNEQFARMLEARGARQLVRYQDPGKDQRLVASTVDSSGNIELIKEIRDESDGPLGPTSLETAILVHLMSQGYKDANIIGVDSIDGHMFLRRGFIYGSPLSNTQWKCVGISQTLHLTSKLAKTLAALHKMGVVLLDLRPDNVLTDGTVFDFSHAMKIRTLDEEVPTFIMDPRYSSPEVVLTRRASSATDVWSLGILIHMMVTGTHPFQVKLGQDLCRDVDFEDRLLYAVPNASVPYGQADDFKGIANVGLANLVSRMLAQDPENRPSMENVAKSLVELLEGPEIQGETPFLRNSGGISITKSPPLVLVPMRAGVPHNGHVNLICRLMDLGFSVLVSLQKSYTSTQADPLPKWVVSKMLKMAVKDRGYSTQNLKIIYTPFDTRRNMHLRFMMMADWEKVGVIVSGNEEVHDLLAPIAENRIFLKSNSVCGDLTDANGTKLRRAIWSGDTKIVRAMIPPVVLRNYPELFSMLHQDHEPDISRPMQVVVDVYDRDGNILAAGHVRPHEGPQETALRVLNISHPGLVVLDDTVPDTLLLCGNQTFNLHYLDQKFTLDEEEGRLLVRYRFEEITKGYLKLA